MRPELLRLDNVHYVSEGEQVLSGFSFVLREGEMVGVLADEGIVKRSITDVITGRVSPDSGRIYIGKEPRLFEGRSELRMKEVGVVGERRSLIDTFNVSDNIFVLRRGLKKYIVNEDVLSKQTSMLLQEYGLSIEPQQLVRNLAPWLKCSIETVKALALGAKFIIFQDLSSFLSDCDISLLTRWAQRFLESGNSFLLLDSSRSYLTAYAERIVFFGSGKNVWSLSREDFESDAAALLLEPSSQPTVSGKKAHEDELTGVASSEKPALSFRAVVTSLLSPLSFRLSVGEELCVLDRKGIYTREISELLRGEASLQSGLIEVRGRPFTARSVREALSQHVAFVVESPVSSMLFPHLSALENLCFASSSKLPRFWMTGRYMKSCEQEYAKYFSPGALRKYPKDLTAAEALALVYCRWHLYMPSVLVCVKPFSMADKRLAEVSEFFISMLRAKGVAVLILASNAPDSNRAAPILRLD